MGLVDRRDNRVTIHTPTRRPKRRPTQREHVSTHVRRDGRRDDRRDRNVSFEKDRVAYRARRRAGILCQ